MSDSSSWNLLRNPVNTRAILVKNDTWSSSLVPSVSASAIRIEMPEKKRFISKAGVLS